VEQNAQSAEAPVFFKRNRVARVYRGGRLFHDFFGDPAEDGSEPEEWIASTVRALNRQPRDPLEGISILEGSDTPFTEFLAANKAEALGARSDLGILVKVLDSAIRLSVQAHPDKAFARKHFRSGHGKTEMWIVLATRENARIHFGFREAVTKGRFLEAVEASERDLDALPQLLNAVPARPGDVYLIPPRTVHAIGAGCLILEVQEPTDFTIAPEAWCGNYRLNEQEMYLGLPRDVALECIDLESLVGERAVRAGLKTPRAFMETGGVVGEKLISHEDTPDFAVNRYRLRAGSLRLAGRPGVYVVTGGAGSLSCGKTERGIGKGGYFFLPAAAAGATVETSGDLQFVECLPPSAP
jgi:mannose-6-phosphate isomerase